MHNSHAIFVYQAHRHPARSLPPLENLFRLKPPRADAKKKEKKTRLTNTIKNLNVSAPGVKRPYRMLTETE